MFRQTGWEAVVPHCCHTPAVLQLCILLLQLPTWSPVILHPAAAMTQKLGSGVCR